MFDRFSISREWRNTWMGHTGCTYIMHIHNARPCTYTYAMRLHRWHDHFVVTDCGESSIQRVSATIWCLAYGDTSIWLSIYIYIYIGELTYIQAVISASHKIAGGPASVWFDMICTHLWSELVDGWVERATTSGWMIMTAVDVCRIDICIG